jgi:hypothetical protein
MKMPVEMPEELIQAWKKVVEVRAERRRLIKRKESIYAEFLEINKKIDKLSESTSYADFIDAVHEWFDNNVASIPKDQENDTMHVTIK